MLIKWLSRILLAAVVLAAAYYLGSRSSQVWHTLHSVPPTNALVSQLAVLAAMVVATYGWQAIVNELGEPVTAPRAGQIYLVGQLGKYLPGSFWAYLLQMELGNKAGVSRTRVFTASIIQFAISLVAATALGLIALPTIIHRTPLWLFALVPLGIVALHPKLLTWATNRVLRILRRPPLTQALTWRTILTVLASATGTYALYGLHLWLLAGTNPLLCTGAIAIGLSAGVLLFVLPSGAGLRDVVVAAVLATTIGPVQAAAFALVSRLMCTVGDLLTAGAAALLARWRAPLTPATD